MEKKLSSISENMRRNFTANVSHELKTPITSISGYAEMMMTGLARSEDLPLLAEKIYTEAQRLIALIDDIARPIGTKHMHVFRKLVAQTRPRCIRVMVARDEIYGDLRIA